MSAESHHASLRLGVAEEVLELLLGALLGDIVRVDPGAEEAALEGNHAVAHGDRAVGVVVRVDAGLLGHLVAAGDALSELDAGANVLDGVVQVGVDRALLMLASRTLSA